MDTCVENGKLLKKTEDILTEKELHHIVKQTTNQIYEIIDYHIRLASEDGLKGFVGDHFKMTINVKENDCMRKIHLFIKTLPLVNRPKADFIVENQFFNREALMFNLLEEMQEMGGQNSWYTKAFIHNDNVLVMPDLCEQGYKTYPVQRYLDKDHIFATVSAVALFHAAFAKYESKKKSEDHGYNFMDKYGDTVLEPPMSFGDTLWVKSGAKLTNNFLREFSSKQDQYPADLEAKLCELYIKGSNTLKEYKDTLNVIVHKDLWANNILFKYNGDEVTNAVLLDFQCIRYGPPEFDVMSLLYLTTSRDFRDRYENVLLRHYYSEFTDNVDELTKQRMRDLSYDEDAFLIWCEKARKFGMVVAIMIFPYCLMDPDAAQKVFDDPDTYIECMAVDRSAPVISHAWENSQYRNRQLEVCEEFVERFVTA
ncbi:uncharacterized protein [Maniola hyperantus]|uniref:uncharacterized protein n=1 Tax=Aphantopus hyperantus TaxID=2795564 RepID=UPI0015689DEC|nr:uncharacterized protein LOC117988863 [Maniola hyperantus]